MIPKGGFTEFDELVDWIKTLPEKQAVNFARLLASRTALRVPLFNYYFGKIEFGGTHWRKLATITAIRAMFIGDFLSKFPIFLVKLGSNSARQNAFSNAASFDQKANFQEFSNFRFSFKAAAFSVSVQADESSFFAAENLQIVFDSAEFILRDDELGISLLEIVTADARMLDAGATPAQMAATPLWPADSPYKPAFDRKTFLAAAPSFEVWLDWYEPIVEGKAPWGLPRDVAEKLEMRIALGDDRGEGGKEFWDRPHDEVNAEIKSWVDAARAEVAAEIPKPVEVPDEPAAGHGPQYAVIEGRLSAVTSAPQTNELGSQRNLHQRLAKQSADFAAECQRLSNQHPILASAASEYAMLLGAEIENLDVTGVWSVGGALAGFATAFSEQNMSRTLTEPLEPHLAAQLQSIVRQHGAFILGFEEGRDLVNRADDFLIDRARLEQIAEPGNVLIAELSSNRHLVDEATIALHKPISDFVHENGWKAGRTVFACYLVIRNSVRSIVKGCIGREPNAVDVYAAVEIAASTFSISLGQFSQFVLAYGPQLLQFFAHSPEMHAYVQWAIHLLENEETRQKGDK